MQEPNPMSPWQAWAYDVQRKLHEQQACIEKLEARISALFDQVKQLEARPAYNIESIEYHFDQLKVESLEGTLNIGMTAPAGAGGEPFPGSIDQMSAGSPQVFPSAAPGIQPSTGPYNDIFAEMNRYLDTQAVNRLMDYEQELSIPLDPYHRKIVIDDIRQQMPSRIQFYLNQSNKKSTDQSSVNKNGSLTDNVLAKTKRDTDAALLAYMRQLQSGTPASGGMA